MFSAHELPHVTHPCFLVPPGIEKKRKQVYVEGAGDGKYSQALQTRPPAFLAAQADRAPMSQGINHPRALRISTSYTCAPAWRVVQTIQVQCLSQALRSETQPGYSRDFDPPA